MKRQARRSARQLTDAEQTELQQLAAMVDKTERPEIIARARELREQLRKSVARLTEVFTLLRAERERQGLSLADLQERTGIDRSALSRLENAADPNPTFATLQRYAAALGKEFEVILVDQR